MAAPLSKRGHLQVMLDRRKGGTRGLAAGGEQAEDLDLLDAATRSLYQATGVPLFPPGRARPHAAGMA